MGSLLLYLTMALTTLTAAVSPIWIHPGPPPASAGSTIDAASSDSSPASTSFAPQPPVTAAPSWTSSPPEGYSERLYELTQRDRGSSLTWSPPLADYASRKAEDLLCEPALVHSTDEELVSNRGWSYVGENLAMGWATPDEAEAAYVASPTHLANITFPGYTHVGISSMTCPATGSVYSVTIFGQEME